MCPAREVSEEARVGRLEKARSGPGGLWACSLSEYRVSGNSKAQEFCDFWATVLWTEFRASTAEEARRWVKESRGERMDPEALKATPSSPADGM